MIYRLESGVDTEIKEKIITAMLIVAATVGIPALAAVINKVSPFQGRTPGSSLGVSSEVREDSDASSPGSDDGNNTTPSSEARVSAQADNPNPPQKLDLATPQTAQPSSSGAIGSTCACPEPMIKPNPIGGGAGPDVPPEETQPTEPQADADLHVEAGIEGVLDAEAEVNIDEDPGASLDIRL